MVGVSCRRRPPPSRVRDRQRPPPAAPEACERSALPRAAPSVVCRIVPPAPTAQPSLASAKATAFRSVVVPEWRSAASRSCRRRWCGGSCRRRPRPSRRGRRRRPRRQVGGRGRRGSAAPRAAPSVVCRIVPPAPTAQPSLASAKATAFRSVVVAEWSSAASRSCHRRWCARWCRRRPRPSRRSRRRRRHRSGCGGARAASRPRSRRHRSWRRSCRRRPRPSRRLRGKGDTARALPVPELCGLQPAAAQATVAASRGHHAERDTRPPVVNSRRLIGRAIASTLLEPGR